MFETLKIKYRGHQPVANISDRTLDRLIRRDYGNYYGEVKQKLESIVSISLEGKNRLLAAVLKISNGDIAKIDSYITLCNNDYRDVLSQAEYPKMSKQGFGQTSANKLKDIYLKDWLEYSKWLKRK